MNLLILADITGWTNFWWFPIGLVVGGIVGFFVARSVFTNQLKKNPPITKNMIRAMYMSMGRKPSEKDINRTMEAMNRAK